MLNLNPVKSCYVTRNAGAIGQKNLQLYREHYHKWCSDLIFFHAAFVNLRCKSIILPEVMPSSFTFQNGVISRPHKCLQL